MYNKVRFAAKNNIPILDETNLLVVGGGLAGLAAAKEYASRGKKAYIIESSISVGYEMTICMRPWVNWREFEREMAEGFFPESGNKNESQTVSYTMRDLKCRFEDLMMENGVKILYASTPIKCEQDGDKYFVTIANKSGVQAIVCDKILDTTQSGLMSLIGENTLTGANVKFEEEYTYARITMEFTGVKQGYEKTYKVPETIKFVENGMIEVYQGAFSQDHVIVDIPLNIKNIDSICYKQDIYVENQARNICFEVAEYLHKEIPLFSDALLGLISKKTLRAKDFDPVKAIADGLKIGREISANESELESKAIYQVKTMAVDSSFSNTFQDLEFSSQNDMAKIRGLKLAEKESFEFPVISVSDVNVAGGGTSGAVSAVASAREGVKTTLVEMNHMLGGTGTVGGVNMYWLVTPLKYTKEIDSATIENQNKIGFPERYLDYNWTLPSGEVVTHQKPFCWSMEIKAKTLLDMCLAEDVEVFTNANIFGAVKRRNKVEGVCFATEFGPFAILSKTTVDATGDGDVAAFSGAEYVYGNTRDRFTMWTAMSPFNKPANYGMCFFVTGDVEDIIEFSNFVMLSRKRPDDQMRYDHSNMVSPRETRHITGELELGIKHQLLLSRFPDTIYIAYSNYDLKGKTMADAAILGIIPPAMDVEIPYRAVIPKQIEGIIMTGRCYSITHDALAAPRMQTDMQEFGAACGMAAAMSVKQGVLPRQLNIRPLQEKLVHQGSMWDRVLDERQYEYNPDEEIKEVICNLTGDEEFSWLLMASDERMTEIPEVAKVYYASSEKAVPVLLEEYEKAQGFRKTLLARMLAWHGNDAGKAELIDYIRYHLDKKYPLPKVERENYFAGTSPNQQNVPEVVFWLNAFSRIDSDEIIPIYAELAERIHAQERDYKNKKASIFDYIECIAYTAERVCKKDYIPILKRLLELPELQNCVVTTGFETDFYKERQAYLVMYIYRAIARCGDKLGLLGLCEFLKDKRMTLSKNSYIELMQLTGLNYIMSYGLWSEALNDWPDSFAPMPWRGEVD